MANRKRQPFYNFRAEQVSDTNPISAEIPKAGPTTKQAAGKENGSVLPGLVSDSTTQFLPATPTESFQGASDESCHKVASEADTELQDQQNEQNQTYNDSTREVTDHDQQNHGNEELPEETPPPEYESPDRVNSGRMSRKSTNRAAWAESPHLSRRRSTLAPKPTKAEEMEISETSQWKLLFKEFTQDTTLHGIRFTTINTNFRSRRFLWILMILAALIIFLYYLSDRLIQYFKYEKVISVEESYVDQMEYPAITLCNQNTFKLTEAVKGGWYDKVQTVLNLTATSAAAITCGIGKFKCSGGSCINDEKKCDHFCDCLGCNDENNCELLPRIDIHSSSNLPAILGQNYELYSSNNGIRPVYVQLSTSNVVYLRYDDDITKWVFSNRLNGGILYASTLSTSSETYPQHVSQDWRLHDDNSVINITFSSSDPIRIEHSITKLATNPKPDITLEEMYRDAGHKTVAVDDAEKFKKDCKWKKNDCDSSHFKELFTDMGLCYTFTRNDLMVENSGPGYGLKLTINIEAYEYTKDLTEGVGIKALLHDPLEIPLMEERGFAVSPGLYSFVSVERTQIKNLEPPWGNCSSPDLRYYDHYSISSCKMDCENKALREKCNCRDVHMPPTGNNLCTVDEWVQCASPLISSLRKAGNFCMCATPCEEIRYIPTLTFASISADTDSADAQQQEQNKVYAEKLSEARETRFRINDEKYTETLRVFFSMSMEYSRMYLFLMSAEQRLSGETEGIDRLTSLLREDCQQFNKKQRQVVTTLQSDLLHVVKTYQLHAEMHLYASLQQLQWVWEESMNAVSNATNQEEEEATFRRVNESIWAHMSMLPAVFEVLSNDLFNYTKEVVQNMTQDLEYRLLEERLLSIDEQASATCDGCFTDSLQNQLLTQIVQEAMLTYIETTLYKDISTMKQRFLQVYFEYANGSVIPEPEIVCMCPNYTDYNATIEMTTEATTETMTNSTEPYIDNTWDSRINFNWTTILNDIEALVGNASNFVQEIRSNLTEPLNNAADYVAELIALISPKCSGELEKLYNEYADTQERILDVLNKLKQKLLARNNTNTERMNSYEKVETTLTELAAISDLDTFVTETKDELITTESLLYELRFTEVRLEKHIGNVEYWFMAQFKDDYLKGNSSYWLYFDLDTPQLLNVRSSYNDVKTKPIMTSTNIVQWWNKSIDNVDDIISELESRRSIFLKMMQVADTYLDDFALGNQIDESFIKGNFLQLDIYYKELSEKKLRQQKAYDYPALLSEVGGLMGLMLGASVMTVCELIDLLIYNGVIKCVGRIRVGNKNDNDKVQAYNKDDTNEENLDSQHKNGTV